MTHVSTIHIYPIKSTKGITLTCSLVNELGLGFDRRFIVCDPTGNFITARTMPQLCLVQTEIIENGVTLSAPHMKNLTLLYKNFSHLYRKVSVWGDEVNGQICSETANNWFSEYLQSPCELVFFGQQSYRERKPNTHSARKLAFTDGYPLLLISQASLNQLNTRLVDDQQDNVSMSQFRPNVVIDNCQPFAEDTWQHIRIGEVEFKVSKPCERCIFTTVNPKTGVKHPQQQPLSTLKSFRKTPQGEVLFGQNLIALNSGIINQGDELTVISHQNPPTFSHIEAIKPSKKPLTSKQDNLTKSEHLMTTSAPKKITVYFEKWNKKYSINAPVQQDSEPPKTLLENGEAAGLILPYSCRGGICGRCKAQLVSGKVMSTSTDALLGLTQQEQEQGYILCCSSVALSDVVLKHP